MTRRLSQRFAVGGLAAGTFTAGLLVAGILDLPHRSAAQAAPHRQAVAARLGAAAPRRWPRRGLSELSEAFASVAERVKPSVVYIRAEGRSEARPRPQLQVPPGFERFFPGIARRRAVSASRPDRASS